VDWGRWGCGFGDIIDINDISDIKWALEQNLRGRSSGSVEKFRKEGLVL
jgi:hypothetical protein